MSITVQKDISIKITRPMRGDLVFVKTVAVESDALLRTSWQVDALGQWSQAASMEQSIVAGWETRARIDPALVMWFRELFLENRCGADRELFDDLLGYVAKVEQGKQHGAYHIHVLFLFDAKRVKNLDWMMALAQVSADDGRATRFCTASECQSKEGLLRCESYRKGLCRIW
jgi:hypothetical protein